jgi:ribosomal protein S18 acetylase RimI-like enzyme
MKSFRVLAATAAELPDAQELVFEYLASTQQEGGRAVPTTIDELPSILYTECSDLASAYQVPGALLLAYLDHQPIGCVGLSLPASTAGLAALTPRSLKPTHQAGTIEVKRLYVRPAHRRGGVARRLMQHAHHHAASHGFTRLVLDVMPTRTHVIDFYRRLGYTDIEPCPATWPYPMVYLQCRVESAHAIP